MACPGIPACCFSHAMTRHAVFSLRYALPHRVAEPGAVQHCPGLPGSLVIMGRNSMTARPLRPGRSDPGKIRRPMGDEAGAGEGVAVRHIGAGGRHDLVGGPADARPGPLGGYIGPGRNGPDGGARSLRPAGCRRTPGTPEPQGADSPVLRRARQSGRPTSSAMRFPCASISMQVPPISFVPRWMRSLTLSGLRPPSGVRPCHPASGKRQARPLLNAQIRRPNSNSRRIVP